jgi:8-oxo-dGTP pyrophosphatase MutT (NUDIX family)
MEMLDCVAFLLVEGDTFLAERRSMSKTLYPGAVAIPGGHLEDGESIEEALDRELDEELEIRCRSPRYVCTLLDRSIELRRLHYYAVEAWAGEIGNNEAEEVTWIRFDDLDALTLEADRVAVREYLRHYR